MLRLGLTGGIGSGKSTVASLLAMHGARIVDTDALSRSTTAAGGTAMPQIAAVFGPDFVQPDGALDRSRMRALAFAEPDARRRLEAIVHPLVRQATDAAARNALESGVRVAVFDVPLLVESGQWAARLDRILVVDCSIPTQIARTTVRSGLDEATVRRIIAAQASREARRAAADTVLFNEGLGLPDLAREVARAARHIGL
ncbi:dephospho-CoA kinase [Xylophilus ampelinus]|uniref:Dephospho-CoA kinase n=1 Tax=Xylophilus ampelinus TaxID=54067 RepID=A0A318SHN9_9BURK|nr:dephospho-CoA kinase [Xylophilus ampelinus]MCS4510178.1 dephospho-CoA kinase [Xylophilus ampelinus]PYE78328.1 dephospho-CoA kinase [Xylophilus ampelinus]